ncbi:MAG: hypothetical protein U0736_21100 [Gemmataceae bacterium]
MRLRQVFVLVALLGVVLTSGCCHRKCHSRRHCWSDCCAPSCCESTCCHPGTTGGHPTLAEPLLAPGH